MSISKLYNSFDLSNLNKNQTNLIFFTSNSRFNIIRSKFNALAPCNIKLYDISEEMDVNTLEYSNQVKISISDQLIKEPNVLNLSKSADKRYNKNIGWQRHLNHSSDHGYSSGHLRGLGKNMEPIFRNEALFQFNLDAIRKSDLPQHKYSSPTGFTIEEACQIARYIGSSTRIKAFNLICSQEHISENMAEAIATILWYLFEGLSTAKNHPENSEEFSEFIVMYQEDTYTFLQSNINGKWWLKFQDNFYPCTIDEYKDFTKGKISNRLINIIE